MTRPAPRPAAGRARTRKQALRRARRPALKAAGILGAVCLAAAACGGSDPLDRAAAPDVAGASAPDALSENQHEFLTVTRPGAGIVAAGGQVIAIGGASECSTTVGHGVAMAETDAVAMGDAAAGPIKIAYVGANLAQLEAIGLAALDIEEPGRIIHAYVDEINVHGGIRGRCVEFLPYLWDLADPVAAFADVCTRIPQENPVAYFTLAIQVPIIDCATIEAKITTVGIYATGTELLLSQADGRLYLDEGSVEHVLSSSMELALSSEIIGAADRIGLLHGSGPSVGMMSSESEEIIAGYGLDTVAVAEVPPEYGDLQLLLYEDSLHLLEPGLSEDELAEAERVLATLPPELAETYVQIEQFYSEAANRFKNEGITAVATTVYWSDLRRMMRAAERIGWFPTWVFSDLQPATVAMAGVPPRQAANAFQISSRRAAGDPIVDVDQACVVLRNSASDLPHFGYRLHSDAWTLLTATCEYLDVLFAAMTRVQGTITADSLATALESTHYETQSGGLISFSPGDYSGADRFRTLETDPDCVLNHWGCMRSISDWTLPTRAVGITE